METKCVAEETTSADVVFVMEITVAGIVVVVTTAFVVSPDVRFVVVAAMFFEVVSDVAFIRVVEAVVAVVVTETTLHLPIIVALMFMHCTLYRMA